MNSYRIAAVLLAVFCVTVALGIAYRKWVIPWQDERDWRRENMRKLAMFAKQQEMVEKRRAAVKNGRSERRAPGDRNVAN